MVTHESLLCLTYAGRISHIEADCVLLITYQHDTQTFPVS